MKVELRTLCRRETGNGVHFAKSLQEAHHSLKYFEGSAVHIKWLSSSRSLRPVLMALASILATIILTATMQSQNCSVIHNLTGGADGGIPWSGLTPNGAGSFYGTSSSGANKTGNCGTGCGAVFKLVFKGSSWVLTPLYDFKGGDDGDSPSAALTLGPDGAASTTLRRRETAKIRMGKSWSMPLVMSTAQL